MIKKKRRTGRPYKYPWSRWLRGKRKRKTLKKGVDFDCEPYVMAQQIRNHCNRHSMTCSVSVEESSVIFSSGKK